MKKTKIVCTLAGPAPAGKKIDEHKTVRLEHLRLKILIVQNRFHVTNLLPRGNSPETPPL